MRISKSRSTEIGEALESSVVAVSALSGIEVTANVKKMKAKYILCLVCKLLVMLLTVASSAKAVRRCKISLICQGWPSAGYT